MEKTAISDGSPIMGKCIFDDDEKFRQLKELMRLNPTLADTAAFFDVSADTIERTIKRRAELNYAEFRRQNMVHTRLALTRKAVSRALDDENINNVMMIFCLKNLCNWADNPIPDDEEDMKYERPESMRDDEPDNKAEPDKGVPE